MSAITDNLADIGWGLLVTLVISALSYLGGLLLGSLMAVFRVGPIPPLRALGADVSLAVIHSIHGHDAFLMEYEQLNHIIRPYFPTHV